MSLFVEQEASLIVARLFRNEHWVAGERVVGHAKLLSNLKRQFKEVEMPRDTVQTVHKFESNVKCKVPERVEWASGATPLEEGLILFTDGSKAGEGTGSGVYCEELRMNISIPLGTMATVFHFEIVTLKECWVET